MTFATIYTFLTYCDAQKIVSENILSKGLMCRNKLTVASWYLLVKVCWSGQSACAVADVGLTAADWDTVVPGFFKPAGVPPVRVVVNTTTVKLGGRYSRLMSH